jgi:hypothetical protein
VVLWFLDKKYFRCRCPDVSGMELHTLNPHDVEYFTEITNSEYFKKKIFL